MSVYLLLILIGLPLAGFLLARRQAVAMVGGGSSLHSLPDFHGAYVAAWTGIPATLLVVLWIALQGPVLDQAVFASLPDDFRDAVANQSLVIAEIHSVADGRIFGEPAPEVRAAAERLQTWRSMASWSMVAVAAAAALAGLVVTRSRLAPAFRARHRVEDVLSGLMVVCSVIAVLTTLGILLSLVFESIRFFARVPWYEFLFGLNWEPQIAIRSDQVAGLGSFGAVPVFLGTVVIAVIAMLVATPIGLLSAIYLTEYASPRFRAVAKPSLEILAGIPTVVYGFFAVLTVAPALRIAGAWIGLDVAPNSALAAGSVMGLMIIPFISSLSDDALAAVPQAMRDGSAALGATKVRDHREGAAAGSASRDHGRRPAGGQPGDRRDHDRGDGRRPDRQDDPEPVRLGHHRDRADRHPADRRHRVRQPQDPGRLRPRHGAVHQHALPERGGAADRPEISREI